MHPHATPTRLPRWGPRRQRRCSSFKYSRYCPPPRTPRAAGTPVLSRSRLARGAPRSSRCDARLSPRAVRRLHAVGSCPGRAIRGCFGSAAPRWRSVSLPCRDAWLAAAWPHVIACPRRDLNKRSGRIHRPSLPFFGATILVTRPTLVSPAYRLSCLSMTK